MKHTLNKLNYDSVKKALADGSTHLHLHAVTLNYVPKQLMPPNVLKEI